MVWAIIELSCNEQGGDGQQYRNEKFPHLTSGGIGLNPLLITTAGTMGIVPLTGFFMGEKQ